MTNQIAVDLRPNAFRAVRRAVLPGRALRAAILAALLAPSVPVAVADESQVTLTWITPLTASEMRIGRKPVGRAGGPDKIDAGDIVARYCSETVSLPDGDHLSCKIQNADTGYEYYLCARDQKGENLGGFECTFHGEGDGWECLPADIGAGWCDYSP